MNMQDLKAEAAVAANEIEIDWAQLDNPRYRADFESTLEKAHRYVPELEGLYAKLTSGKSVLAPDGDTPLGYSDIEKYTGLIAEELFSAYILAEVYHKYTMVQNIITLSEAAEG
jgi:hypothetical protein